MSAPSLNAAKPLADKSDIKVPRYEIVQNTSQVYNKDAIACEISLGA